MTVRGPMAIAALLLTGGGLVPRSVPFSVPQNQISLLSLSC